MDGLAKSNPSKAPIALRANLLSTLEIICVGGGSLIVMALCACLHNTTILMRDEVRYFLAQLAALSLLFPALLSYPHSLWSFRFAYFQGSSFLTRHSFALLVFPTLIIATLALSALTWSQPVNSLSAAVLIENYFNCFGIGLNWTKYNSLGQLLLSLLLILQITMGGYHYGMQAVGVAIACGEKRGYSFSEEQKKYLRLNIYALWLVNLLSGYTFLSILDSRAFGYHGMHFPAQWRSVAAIAFAVSIYFVIQKVILPNYRQYRSLPPFPAALSIVSVWLWLQPFFQPYGFQATVVPLAHALQYLYFAARAEARGFDRHAETGGEETSRANILLTLLLFAMLIPLGFFSYKYLPIALDHTPLVKNLAPNFYLLCAYIFLNVQHYVIDSVIWRRDSKLYALIK